MADPIQLLNEADYDEWLAATFGVGQQPQQQPVPYAGPPAWANQVDPMSRAQLEGSRRQIADAQFQGDVLPPGQDIGQTLQDRFMGEVLPHMAQPVQEHMQGMEEASLVAPSIRSGQAFAEGDTAQGIRELAPHAMTAATMGAGPLLRGATGAVGKFAPNAFEQATNYVAQMPGVTGTLARQVGGRAPQAAATVGGIEGGRQVVDAGAALAQQDMPLAPSFKPSNPQSVEALQEFLTAQGFPIAVDGRYGPGTKQALVEYRRQRQRRIKAQNTPEQRKLRALERRATATEKLNQAQQSKFEREQQERARRAGVLAEADERYTNRAQSLGQRLTQFGQDMVGPAIMGGAALLGAKGVAKVPGQRRVTREVDKMAEKFADAGGRPSRAKMKGFNKAFDKATQGSALRQTGETAATLGLLYGESRLAKNYLDDARKEYADALKAFEQAGLLTDGGKERELADRVAKAKAEVQKWERLQGAGLHGMGYFLGGKALTGTANAMARKPSADATALRGQFKEQLKGPSTMSRLGSLFPGGGPKPSPGPTPPPSTTQPTGLMPTPLRGSGSSQQLPGVSAGPPPSAGQSLLAGLGTGRIGPQVNPGRSPARTQSSRQGASPNIPGSGSSPRRGGQRQQSRPLTESQREKIRDRYIEHIAKNGPNSKPTTDQLMKGLKSGKTLTTDNVRKYIDELDDAFKKGAGGDLDRFRDISPWLRSAVPGAIAGGTAMSGILDDDSSLMDGL